MSDTIFPNANKVVEAVDKFNKSSTRLACAMIFLGVCQLALVIFQFARD